MNLTNFKSGTGTGIIVKHANRELFELYIKDIAKHKPLSREEEQALFVLIKETKDPAAIEKIWKHNLLFVVSVARRYAATIKSSVITMEDLVTDGNIGLYEAIERFDHTQGYKFISYAVWHVKKQILNCINKNLKSIKLPPNIKAEINKVNKRRESLEQQECRTVSTLEVFEAMLSNGEIESFDDVHKLEQMMSLNQFEKSLNDKVGDEDQTELCEMIEDSSPSAEDFLIKSERENLANLLLNDIPSEVSDYIKDYFGIGTNIPLSYTEIAEKYGKKAYYVRNIVEKYLSWIRRKNQNSKEFFFPITSEEMRIKAELKAIAINESTRMTFKKNSNGSYDRMIF
jgi:RNA polymerase sigma factor (sigma-70 family)